VARFIDLVSSSTAQTVLDRLSAAAGWRNDANELVEPFTIGAHRTMVTVRGHAFTVSIYAQRANSFAPVCAGTVVDEGNGKSRVRATLRLSWMTRIFMSVWFGFLALAVAKGYREGVSDASSSVSPAVVGWSSMLIALVLVSPLIGGVIWYSRRAFRADGAQKMLRDVVTRAIG
jgi:hypothetical protein